MLVRPLVRLASLSLVVVVGAPACGGGAGTPEPQTVAKVDPPVKTDASAEAGTAKADDGAAKADGGAATADGGAAKAEAGDAKGETGDAKAEAGDAKAEAGDEKADGGAKSETGGEPTDPTAPAADPATLLTEVKNKKTTDERALAALDEAGTAGAKLRDIAKAANARGEKLFEHPERAKAFFEWAAAKDPKYPDPVFNLAKQAVVTGDVDEVKKHLEQVKARGGKKLLGQIEYDATWEIVKDDPAVRKLLEG